MKTVQKTGFTKLNYPGSREASQKWKEFLSEKEFPTAIFAHNDFMAIGAIEEFQGNCLKVLMIFQ